MNDVLIPILAMVALVVLWAAFNSASVRDYLNERRIERRVREEERRREAELKAAEQEQIRRTEEQYTLAQANVTDALPPLSEGQEEILRRIARGGNFFIQGQAGTGKSTLVAYLRERCPNCAVGSPTGVAARNIGGKTLHSLFNFDPKINFYDIDHLDLPDCPQTLLKAIDLLIIDEVSMVRPDFLDVIDYYAKKSRNSKAPFGGLQVVLIGDLYQLPPVIKYEKEKFQKKYGFPEPFFFDTDAYKKGNFSNLILNTVYRQSDDELLEYLEKLRKKQNLESAITWFNGLKFTNPNDLDTAITIVSNNKEASLINDEKLKEMPGKEKIYQAQINGWKSEMEPWPAPKDLKLKIGALVMVIRNLSYNCVNGSRAVITSMSDSSIGIKLLDCQECMAISRYEWELYGFNDDKEWCRIGTFCQFPLQLCYALTAHKSQGKTLSKIKVRLSKAFAPGQVYVALSRVRQAKDIHMEEPLCPEVVRQDPRVVKFLENCEREQPGALRGEHRLGCAQAG